MARLDAEQRERRFDRLYADTYPAVRAYARRRIDADLAPDVVAETYLVAWRRLDDVPEDPLPWLDGVARSWRSRSPSRPPVPQSWLA